GNDLVPDIDHCGLHTGDVKLARDHVDQAQNDVQIALARISALHDRVAIEIQRLQAVDGIRQDEIAFIDETDQRIDAATAAQNQLSHFQDLIHMASGFMSLLSDLWPLNWGNLPKDFMAAMDGLSDQAINDIKRHIELEKEELLHAQQLRTLEDNR